MVGRMPTTTSLGSDATEGRPPVASVAPGWVGADEGECGLRERKKRETRRGIHLAALEIAREGGVEGLTVDAIAERAGVSPRTFFNYFATKDDAIVGSAPGDLERLAEMIRDWPTPESPRAVVRALMLKRVALLDGDPETWALRRELIRLEPSLGLRFLGMYAQADRVIVEGLVERARGAAGDELGIDDHLEIAVEAYAALGAFRAAIRTYLSGAHDIPLGDIVERAFAQL